MNQLVFQNNNQIVTSSRNIARDFGKEHRNVIRDIERVLKNEQTRKMFSETTYIHEQNKQEYKEFFMNRDGFTLLVMGFTGPEAMEFKLKYIAAFNQMEAQLNQPMSIEDMIINQAQSVKELKQEVFEIKKVVDNEVWLTERQKKTIQDSVSRRVFELRSKGHDAHFQTLYSSLKRFFGVSKYDKIPRKDFDEAVSFIVGWYPSVKKDLQESR